MKYLKNYNTFILEELDYSNKSLKTLSDLKIPNFVADSFDCSQNKLTSLVGCPKKVGNNFYCEYNLLTSLEGAPEMIGGTFNCFKNKLITLLGSPNKISGNFYCYNNELTTLEGAPEYVAENFNCGNNKLETLDYLPRIDGRLSCYNNNWIKPIPYEIMIKYDLHPLVKSSSDGKYVYTLKQFDKFSSFEYQKEFLEREPENFIDLKPIGYANGIEKLFPHLFDMDELGLID
jgi:hypothetical protein